MQQPILTLFLHALAIFTCVFTPACGTFGQMHNGETESFITKLKITRLAELGFAAESGCQTPSRVEFRFASWKHDITD